MPQPISSRFQDAGTRVTGTDHGWTLGGSAGWYWQTDSSLRLNYVFGAPTGHMLLGNRPWELPGVDVNNAEWARQFDALMRRRSFENVLWRRVDGSARWREYLVSGEPMFGPKGRFTGFRGIGHQIIESLAGLREPALQLGDLVGTLAVQAGRAREAAEKTPGASSLVPLMVDMEKATLRAAMTCRQLEACFSRESTCA